MKIRYLDVPEVQETFVDSVGKISFFLETLRLDLCVSRMEEMPLNPPSNFKPSGVKLTACRLVLPAAAMIELHTKLSGLVNAMQQTGAIKRVEPEKPPSEAVN